MAGWDHRLNGREFEWTPGAGDREAWCDAKSGGCKESDTTEWLNWTELFLFWKVQTYREISKKSVKSNLLLLSSYLSWKSPVVNILLLFPYICLSIYLYIHPSIILLFFLRHLKLVAHMVTFYMLLLQHLSKNKDIFLQNQIQWSHSGIKYFIWLANKQIHI